MTTIGPMFGNVPRAVRALRLHAGWTQTALGGRAGLSRHQVSRAERALLGGLTLGTLDLMATALGATLHVQMRSRGEALDRLLDAQHARIQQEVAAMLVGFGWLVQAEVSFNHFGDRGRVDLIAFHPRYGVLVVTEVKSGIGDLQDTFGRLDVKARLGEQIARDLGWTGVTCVVAALVIGNSRAARRAVAEHAALFAQFATRGRQAVAWLRKPATPPPSGLLWFLSRPDARQARTRSR